jgi:putative intracellular protease/amidase
MTTAAKTLGILLFPRFELLDVFGPAEMFGVLDGLVQVVTVSAEAGPVASNQGPRAVADYGYGDCPALDLLLIPGGMGTRSGVDDPEMLDWIAQRAAAAELVMTVCTGTALLAKTGLLDGHRATTNKRAFDWVSGQGPRVTWERKARWVESGKYWTSSGVTAGMDMALAVVERLFGAETAENVAWGTEYEWHRDADWDPFSEDKN